MFRKTHLTTCTTFAWILSSLIAPTAFAVPCDNSIFDLEPTTVWRSSAQFEEHTFRWLLPSTGIATIDLLAAQSSSAWIDVLADACGEEAAEVMVIEQSPRHLVVAVRSAGPIYLAANTEASSFRLITSFIEAEVLEEAFDFGHDGMAAVQTSFLVARSVDKVEPVVIDPDPDGLRAVGRRSASLLTLEPAHRLKVEPVVIDPDPDGLTASSGIAPARSQVLFYEPICRRSEVDDHGDTPSCSTSMTFGRSVSGELVNDWSDDSDVFSFHLAKVSKVGIVMDTEVSDLAYELSSPAGHRVAVDRLRTNDEAGMHLVATLGPGSYFFRVTGTSGAYAIHTMTYD